MDRTVIKSILSLIVLKCVHMLCEKCNHQKWKILELLMKVKSHALGLQIHMCGLFEYQMFETF